MSCANCNKCNNGNARSTHRSDEEKKRLTKRLNIIEGQVKGINQMIAEDRYCDDVLIQIAAVTKSLQTLGNSILENHMKSCMIREINNGNVDIIEDIMQLVKKLQ